MADVSAPTRVVMCALGHYFTTTREASWNGTYCPALAFGGQCSEPLIDKLAEVLSGE